MSENEYNDDSLDQNELQNNDENQETGDEINKGRPFTGTPIAEIQLLKKNFEERSIEDCLRLESLLTRVHFGNELTVDKRQALCKYLQYRSFLQHEVIFNQGDIGQEFFIILKGAVLVKIKDETTQKDYIAAELYSGDSFGELALSNPSSQRRATCVCASESECVVLHLEHYQAILAGEQERAFQERMEFLQQCPVIGDLPEDRLQGILRIVTKRDYLPKQLILRQGDENEDIFVIVKGAVKVVREIKNDLSKSDTTATLDFTLSSNPVQDFQYKQLGVNKQPSRVNTQRQKSVKERAAILKSAKQKMRNAVRRITCTDTAALMWEATIRQAQAAKAAVFTDDLINAFQYTNVIKWPDRLFLEVAALGKYEIFGEKSLTKSTINPVSVLTTAGTSVYIINKWDLLKRITKQTAWSLVETCQGGALDEQTLREKYANSLQWKDYKKLMVKSIVADKINQRNLQPIYIWKGPYRNEYPVNRISKYPWRI